MPGTAVGVSVGEGAGQSTVHLTPPVRRGIAVDGGPGERMPEYDVGIMHADKCRGLSGNQVGKVQPECGRGAGQHRHLAAVDGRREDEGVTGTLRKRPEAHEVDAGDGGPGR